MTITDVQFERNFVDQIGFFDPASAVLPITCIGAGGIGASVLPILANMGLDNFRIIDPDYVNDRNTASQFAYQPSDLGGSKADLCAEYLRGCGAEQVVAERRLVEPGEVFEGIVIGAVDSMASRRVIWGAVTDSKSDVDLYIDGRIGGLMGQMFTVEPFDGEWYEKSWLFGDDKAAPLKCGERAIVTSAIQLGVLITEQVRKFYRADEMNAIVQFDLKNFVFEEIGRTIGS